MSLRQRSHFVPMHGARVQYSLATNVNTPFFQVPKLEFRQGRPCTQAQKWALGPCVHIVFVSSGAVHCFIITLSSCFKMASDRTK